MTFAYSGTDPPRTLADRLRQVNDKLKGLGEQLKSTIASLLGEAIAAAVRDVVRGLLGYEEKQEPRRFDQSASWGRRSESYWDRDDERLWEQDDDRNWQDERSFEPEQPHQTPGDSSRRVRDAVIASVQTALWWLKTQPGRRPVLTTVAVALAAGVTGFVAGPTIGAGVGVAASVASLLLTTGTMRSFADLAAG